MLDFSISIPTRFIFGSGSLDSIAGEIKKHGSRVLLHHDGGSYTGGLLLRIKACLREAGLTFFDISSGLSEPKLSMVLQASALCEENGIDFILAIGGGSVMDSAKAISFVSRNEGDFLDYVSYKKQSDNSIPTGCVVTLSGTGSEISKTAMIVDDLSEPRIKHPLFQESIRFKFAVLDPSLTLTLPMRQTLSGAYDAVVHLLEYYFNDEAGTDLQSRLCEAAVFTLLDNMVKVKEDPGSYAVRSQLQIAATFANSGIFSVGCPSDWAMHYIENPITTATGSPHGSTLSVISLAWMRFMLRRHINKAVRFAENIMRVNGGGDEYETAMKGILKLEGVLERLGLPTRLSHIDIRQSQFQRLAEMAMKTSGQAHVGGVSRLSVPEIVEIYKLAE